MKSITTNLAAIGQKIESPGGGNTLTSDITNIINIVIGVLGLVAVIIIITGGVSYMTSSGDAGKVKKAKDIILYGVIGLVICALAFAIVNFVIVGILGNSAGSSESPSSFTTQATCTNAGYTWTGTTCIDPTK